MVGVGDTWKVWLHQIYLTCDALQQNREQVTFWVIWVFGIKIHTVWKYTLSGLYGYQNQVHTPTFWDMAICVNDHKQFLC